MNAKIAAAISLGASSLALFGVANVANAVEQNPNITQETNNVVNSANPQSEPQSNPKSSEEANKEANKLADEAERLEKEANTEFTKAQDEYNHANQAATDANNVASTAQSELEDAQKEKTLAEENQTKANKELQEKQLQASKAKDEVTAKTKILEAEKNKEKAALDARKDAANAQIEAEELNASAQSDAAKHKELADKADEDLKDKQKAQEKENENLQQAKNALSNAKKEHQELLQKANQLDVLKQNADKLVEENNNNQKKITAQIEALTNPKSASENENVKNLEKEAQEAQEKADSAKTNAAKKNSEVNSASDNLTKAENELKSKNKDFYDLKNAVEEAKRTAKQKSDEYDLTADTEDSNKKVEEKSDFYKFLQYVIDTEKAKKNAVNAKLIADAERAQKVLKGETYTVPDKNKTVGNVTYTTPGYTVYAPTWYNDLVKPGLGRVGSADSLQNMIEASTYYDALNTLRKADDSLPEVGVRLTHIAEGIVHSFYSAAYIGHAASHEPDGVAEDLKTHAYNRSAENVAWSNKLDGHDNTRNPQKFEDCEVTDEGHFSCKINSGDSHNALDGWYTIEKTLYDNTISSGKWANHKLANGAKEILQQHRHDLADFTRNTKTILFENDNDESLTKKFINAVGHYTNFADRSNTAAGFAEGDNSYDNKNKYQDIAMWHGSNESTITVSQYKDLLDAYVKKVNPNNNNLEPDNAEKLKQLNADANLANMAIFNARYKVLQKKHAMSEQDRAAIKGLEEKFDDAVSKFEQAQEESKNANKTKSILEKSAEAAKKLYEEEKQKADANAQLDENARENKKKQLEQELKKLQAASTDLNKNADNAKNTAEEAHKAANAKQATIDGDLSDAVNTAQGKVDAAKQAVQAAEADKNRESEALAAANKKADELADKIAELEKTVEAETKKIEQANNRVSDAQKAVKSANDQQERVNNELSALSKRADEANKKVVETKADVSKKIEAVKAAKKTVADAKAKVASAQATLKAAKAKVTTAQKTVKAAEAKFNEIIKKLPNEATRETYRAKFLAATGRFQNMQTDLMSYTTQLETLTTTLNDNADALNKNVKDTVVPPAPEPSVPVPTPPAPAHQAEMQ